MPTTIAQTKIAAGGVAVTLKLIVKDDPTVGLAVMGKILEQAMLVAAEQVLVPELKRTLSIEGPPVSSPFTPPHKGAKPEGDSQAKPSNLPSLYDSIGAWIHPEGGIAVGSVNKYGLYLEIGTQDMAARPWLVPTLNRTDVMNAFNSAVKAELTRLLESASGDGAPAQPSSSPSN